MVHETLLQLHSKSLATHWFVISGLLHTWMTADEMCGAILCIFRWHFRVLLYPNTPHDGGHPRGSLLQSGWYTGVKINPQKSSQSSPPVRKQQDTKIWRYSRCLLLQEVRLFIRLSSGLFYVLIETPSSRMNGCQCFDCWSVVQYFLPF